MIRLAVPSIDEEDISAVADVLRTGFLVQGPKVREFEEVWSAYIGVKHTVALPNCTSALYLCLVAMGIRPDDEVAVTTYSWPTTANVIRLVGAKPVFVEIDPRTFNMDPSALESVLDSHPKIRAVMPVHTFGGSADIRNICAISDRRGVPVIEDAACALGTQQDGKYAGSFGLCGCFSLHPRKAITTGEGGMVTTNDGELALKLRMLRNHGQDPHSPAPDFVFPGHNMRLTEFQAALGLSQFKKLERIIRARAAGAAVYDRLLEGTDILRPLSAPGTRHVYQSYVVLLPAQRAAHRSNLIGRLKEKGIETTIGTYHMPLIRYYREWGKFRPGDFPVTDDVAARALTLPLYEGLSESDQAHVIRTLRSELDDAGTAI